MLTVLPMAAHAQSAASMSGTVVDTSGAVVIGAQIAITNTATNVEQSTVTSSSGTYSLINVSPGVYTLKATKADFRTQQITDAVLGVNQAAVFNFTFTTGTVNESVTVSAESSTIESSTAELGTVISTKPVNDLPLNGRNFTELLELTPGVSRVSVGAELRRRRAALPVRPSVRSPSHPSTDSATAAICSCSTA